MTKRALILLVAGLVGPATATAAEPPEAGRFWPQQGASPALHADRLVVTSDAHTAALMPAAAANVWTMALQPAKSFGYALRREKQGRRFRVEFDLTREVTPPPAPW